MASSDSHMDDNELAVMRLAQAHFSSQALLTAVQLGIFDIIGDDCMTIDGISSKMDGQPNKEALLRTLRLLVSVGILYETVDNDNNNHNIKFGLSSTGMLLQSSHESSMASFVSHWTELIMWNAWSMLPDYVAGKIAPESSPFQAANNVTLVDYYQQEHNPTSTRHRNNVARVVSTSEIPAVLEGYDWNSLHYKTLVDIGGGYGDMMHAVAKQCPDVQCVCLDLPGVIDGAPPLEGVTFVSGDMFKASTIPSCDAIFMKHVLCDWSDEDAVAILRNCHAALSENGKVILADALIASGDEAFDSRQIQTYIDALLMVVGSRMMERSVSELTKVAKEAKFVIDSVTVTASPSVNITVLSKIR